MLDIAENSVRDARGRFVPGQSGNLAGKLPGTRNRATLLKAALESEEGPAMARIVIDKALAGDVVTARFCLDRLEPRPRGRTIAIDLPEGARASDLVAAFDATVRAMAAGEITRDEAVQVTRVLDGRRKAIEAARRETEMRRRDKDEDTDEIEPSPRGRGLGEGVCGNSSGDAKLAAKRPHPDPLPRGEGMSALVAESNLPSAGITPYPPIADAMGPPERLSKGLSRPFDKSSGGRGASRANLLHSTCISSLPGVMGWAARGRSGANAAMGLA